MKKYKHKFKIFEITSNYFIGIVPTMPGAASFAKTKEELILRLKNAIHCIEESKNEI